jgi:hypothetical protein
MAWLRLAGLNDIFVLYNVNGDDDNVDDNKNNVVVCGVQTKMGGTFCKRTTT